VANSLLKLYRRLHGHFLKTRLIPRTWLNLKYAFVPFPRFPRLAEYAESFGVDDIRTTASLWNDAMDFYDGVKSRLPFRHEIRYEDLMENPRSEMERILDFCGLRRPDRDAAFWGKVGEMGAIKHRNSYENFELIEAICKDNLRKRGYLETAS
jgi:hypothetical protein